MLINLYNGKAYNEFIDVYAEIAQILHNQKANNEYLAKNGHPIEIPFNANELLKQFNQRINEIMGSVKTKLTDDARQDNLIIKRRVETTNSQ